MLNCYENSDTSGFSHVKTTDRLADNFFGFSTGSSLFCQIFVGRIRTRLIKSAFLSISCHLQAPAPSLRVLFDLLISVEYVQLFSIAESLITMSCRHTHACPPRHFSIGDVVVSQAYHIVVGITIFDLQRPSVISVLMVVLDHNEHSPWNTAYILAV